MNRSGNLFYEFHDFRIDLEKRVLLRNGKFESVSPKMFDTLLLLIRNSNRVVSIDELRQEVWHGVFTTTNNINVHIAKLRKALGQGRIGHQCIETIEKQGYRFACEVRRVSYEAFDPLVAEDVNPDPTLIADEDTAAKRSQSPGKQIGVPGATNTDQITASAICPTNADHRSSIGLHKVIAIVLLILPAGGYLIWELSVCRAPRVSNPVLITRDGLRKNNSFVTDGSRLYFSEMTAGQQVLFQVLSTGSEKEKVIASFPSISLLDISPDGTELLVGSQTTVETEMPLWIMKVLNSSVRKLLDLRAHAGTWSPDGKHIIYANGYTLYMANNDGTGSREFIRISSGLPYNLRWSPDESLLRFEVLDPENRSTSLWEVNANGTNLHPLLPGWNNSTEECCGNWTPDGKYFIFQATHNQVTNIWAICEETGLLTRSRHEPVRLTDGSMSFRSPVPSKDGRRLFAIGERRLGELEQYNANTQQWSHYLSGISADNVGFSALGEWIAYVTYPGGELWKMKADGSERQQLTFPPMRVHYPRWSPDGRRLCFTATQPGRPWKIYVLSAEGGNAEQLLSGDDNEYGPGWSPSGKHLVFWQGKRLLGTTAIYLLDLLSREVSKLPGSDGLFSPRWSPKGDYIAALSSLAAEKLMIYDLIRGGWSELVTMNVASPSWSRDGRYIYFMSFYQDDSAVFRVRVEDRKIEQWALLTNVRLTSGRFGPWMGLAPDDSVLVLRDVGTQDIYAFDLQRP